MEPTLAELTARRSALAMTGQVAEEQEQGRGPREYR